MKYIIRTLLLACCCMQAQAQAPWKPDTELEKQLQQSNHVHRIMKANPAHAGLTRWEKKEVLKSRVLPLAEDFGALRHTGPGTIHVDRKVTVSGKGSVRLDTPASLGKKNPTNRNYATPEIIRPLDREDLREYNRFSVWVYVDAPGVYLTFAGFTLYNEGEKIMPTPGRFEGQHFETVYPNKWQHIIWEIPDLYRDCVTGFSVNIMLAGAPAGASEHMSLYIDDMRIEKVEAENSRGFDLRKDAMAYCHSGYKPGARKQALVQHVPERTFSLHDAATGQTVYQGKASPLNQDKKQDKGFLVLDFSSFNTPGQYFLSIGDVQSKPFPIGNDAYLSTAWHTLNFFFSERCGFDQPGIHQECHQDVFAYHPDGRSMNIAGGWHDAADLTQGTGNTAESCIALLEMAGAVQGKDSIFYERLLEEARWGVNWILRFRGFHAVVMGKAKAAFILARLFNDKALRDIATRQVEYILGYNPFAMSTVYGDGYDYPPLYGAYAGDVVGAVPVGIETFENEDEPYFPMQNNCTYKEIWTHTTARLMWCVAELFK